MEVYQVIDDEIKVAWRNIPKDDDIQKMKTGLENIKLLTGICVLRYNILLLGMAVAGRSSFLNTVATVFGNKVTIITPSVNSQTDVLNEVHAYDILNKNGDTINIRIFDINGYKDESLDEHELDMLLEGKIPPILTEKTQACDDKNVTQKPTINEEIHLVCLVIDSTKYKEQSDKIKSVKNHVCQKGLPVVAVATKLDQLCPKIFEDADHVYNSSIARDETRTISEVFGFEMRQVFPIVNYTDDREEICPGKNKLVIEALHSMIQITQDYLTQHTDDVTARDINDATLSVPTEEVNQVINEVSMEEIIAGKILVSTDEGNKICDDVTTVDGGTLSGSTEYFNQLNDDVTAGDINDSTFSVPIEEENQVIDEVSMEEINAGKLLVSTDEGNKIGDDVTTVDISGRTLSVSTEDLNQANGEAKSKENTLHPSSESTLVVNI